MKGIVVILLCFVGIGASGQDAVRKNGFGINQDYNDYNVRLLDNKIFSFDSSLSNSFRVSYGRYLNRTWEFNAGITNGFILNQQQGDHFIKKSYNFGVDADILFKLANGKFFPQDARVAPYFSFGYNLNYMNRFKDVGLSPYTLGNEYGVGFKIRIGERSYINLHTALDQQLSGDFDTHMQYRAGFTQTIGKRAKDMLPTDDPLKKDYDEDGIVDVDDECPTIAGVYEKQGCPLDWVGNGVPKVQQDSLLMLLDALEEELLTLRKVVDSLQKEGPIVLVDKSGSEKTDITDKTDEAGDSLVENPVKTDDIPKDVVVAGDKSPTGGNMAEPKSKTDPQTPGDKQVVTTTITTENPDDVDAVSNYYDTKSIGQAYYVVAISCKDKDLAEHIATLLDKDYPTVKVLPQPNGFYRVGVYATRDKSEALYILQYAKTHGIPSGWLSFE